MRKFLIVVLFFTLPIFGFGKGPHLLRGLGLTFGNSQLPNYLMLNNQFNWNHLERVNRNSYLIGLHYIARTNVYSWNKDNSISLDLRPTLGFYIAKPKEAVISGRDDSNFPFFFRLPIIFEWNNGLLSTVETDRNTGFGLGLGLNYQFMYDIDYHSYDEQYYSSPEFTVIGGAYALWQPAINLSFRHWTGSNYCTEYNLNYGFGQEIFRDKQYNRNTITLSISAYFNY